MYSRSSYIILYAGKESSTRENNLRIQTKTILFGQIVISDAHGVTRGVFL